MKRWMTLVLAAAFLIAAPVWAGSHGDRQCALKGDCPKADCSKPCGDDECPCPVTKKFMKKAHFFLSNADEIGLSEDQVAQIKALKLESKKAMIQAMAGMEVFALEMDAKLSETNLDTAALNQMVDATMAQMAAGTKAGIERYAKLKAVLSDDQMKKAKEIWKKKKD